jgi:hypothetical protein
MLRARAKLLIRNSDGAREQAYVTVPTHSKLHHAVLRRSKRYCCSGAASRQKFCSEPMRNAIVLISFSKGTCAWHCLSWVYTLCTTHAPHSTAPSESDRADRGVGPRKSPHGMRSWLICPLPGHPAAAPALFTDVNPDCPVWTY